ncbi:ATP-binding cassette sub-family D member 4 [Phycomyces nitens]|nr:ATP-binding cassette sub-family D member 4 [Phycomyces nitens]
MRERQSSANESLDPLIELTSHDPEPPRTYSLDYLFLKRLGRLLRLLFRPPGNTHRFWSPNRETRQKSIFWLYCTFIMASCGKEVLVYFVGLMPSRFYGILTSKDLPGFMAYMVPCFFLVFGISISMSILDFIGGLFALKVRRLLTDHLQDRYVKPKAMYTLVLNHESVDNPDQRITQDIDKLSESLRQIVATLIIAPLLVVYYTWKCWAVGGFVGPLMIYLYFIVGTVISRKLIKPIVNSVFYKELHEGNFRFHHVRLRQYVESIAFSGGEKEENARAHNSLSTLLTYQRSIPFTLLSTTTKNTVANGAFAYLGSILSYMIVAIPIFSGAFDDRDPGELSSIISKNSFVSMYLIYQFTVIIEQSGKLSDLAGYTARVAELLEAMDNVDNEIENIEIDYPYREDDQSESIEFENVDLLSPRSKCVVLGFNLKINKGDHIVLTGPNGCGKTSILRALAGLWPCTKGRVRVPKFRQGKDIIFLPQVPYLVHGSLRDQIIYPSITSTVYISDQEIRGLLVKTHLSHLEGLIESFDHAYAQEWNKLLSPGEQQRLMFARIFYWKPRFAVLDEATSTMDNATEKYLYSLTKELGITLISVSHHPSVYHFHKRHVTLDGHGGYTINDIPDYV